MSLLKYLKLKTVALEICTNIYLFQIPANPLEIRPQLTVSFKENLRLNHRSPLQCGI